MVRKKIVTSNPKEKAPADPPPPQVDIHDTSSLMGEHRQQYETGKAIAHDFQIFLSQLHDSNEVAMARKKWHESMLWMAKHFQELANEDYQSKD